MQLGADHPKVARAVSPRRGNREDQTAARAVHAFCLNVSTHPPIATRSARAEPSLSPRIGHAQSAYSVRAL